jgi:PBP1b-binding outer membrane lipoprotein LpoB
MDIGALTSLEGLVKMSRKLILLVFALLFTGCSNSEFQSYKSVKEHSTFHLEYIYEFELGFNDFEVTRVEYVEDQMIMFYYIYYNGYFQSDIPSLDITAGDMFESTSLCWNEVNSAESTCINGSDVTSNNQYANIFFNILEDKDNHNYYDISGQELDDWKTLIEDKS